uniref:Uncharacterized protein n=1 Tax=Anguilla anguilla TaxID=7936 RepID=A0A0E9R1I0_ANGAN
MFFLVLSNFFILEITQICVFVLFYYCSLDTTLHFRTSQTQEDFH